MPVNNDGRTRKKLIGRIVVVTIKATLLNEIPRIKEYNKRKIP